LLRELAGPLDVDDMKALFAPPPFGVPAPPSTMQIVSVSPLYYLPHLRRGSGLSLAGDGVG
jgi:hypothetical protein